MAFRVTLNGSFWFNDDWAWSLSRVTEDNHYNKLFQIIREREGTTAWQIKTISGVIQDLVIVSTRANTVLIV
jgi:hypothetical protein